MSRQNYYKGRRQRQCQAVQEEAILSWVHRERQLQPKLGGLKLHHKMNEQEVPFRIGRDRLFALLGKHGLLVEREPGQPRTTNSYHTLPLFTNQIADRPALGPDEVWLCDLTYIRTREGYSYLFLISDQYSRKIVGYHLSQSMQTADALKALDQALQHLPADKRPYHHSDRGCQYCSHEYVEELAREGLTVSMTEQNHCYENAQAERVNGILKQEYGLGDTLPTREMAQRAVNQAVSFYNTIRPHRSLNMDYPERVHQRAAPMGAIARKN